jgi:hypothetical protein
MSKEKTVPDKGQLLLYQTQDNLTRIDVRLEEETVWLTQSQMAELFQTSVPNVSMHIRNLFQEGELPKDSVVKEFLTTAADGKSYKTNHYNLDVIISVGHRVKSLRGTQFRMWATQRLREFLVKGFVLDDDRLSEGKTEPRYFDELITRIRAIRASERNFYRKVQDIYATSIDYDPAGPITQEFFANVQNKMHWAVHGRTAAEIIAQRADASKPNMGLTSWKGKTLTKADALIAKNYLSILILRSYKPGPESQCTCETGRQSFTISSKSTIERCWKMLERSLATWRRSWRQRSSRNINLASLYKMLAHSIQI